ncbi:hypothetical protein [Enterovirga sp.]|uniref:hypothetical protein n=1 Tax=Enterovirga sp. TaxID=2026350 RepID=UPI002BD83995|nr:hypothetical protein [Enterovirga sp.]HMO29764.1 hypothetical protein [Enterovirga sp.]
MPQLLGEERRVVPFAVPAGRARRRLVLDSGGQGAILLFTGVRYTRIGTGEPAPPRAPPGAGPRPGR